MGRRRWWIVGSSALALIAGAAFIRLAVFTEDAPPAVGLSSPTGGATPSPPDGFDGAWTLDTTMGSLADGTATFAGYRIEEQVAGVGANTVAGRTAQVVATMTIEGTQVRALDVAVDMTTVRTDEERRDRQLAREGLETTAFPTASFTLTAPIEVGAAPAIGVPIQATASGALTLHGVTRDIEVPIQAQWTGSRIEVAASFPVTLADYEIEAPTGLLVLSVEDAGIVELHLLFQKA